MERESIVNAWTGKDTQSGRTASIDLDPSLPSPPLPPSLPTSPIPVLFSPQHVQGALHNLPHASLLSLPPAPVVGMYVWWGVRKKGRQGACGLFHILMWQVMLMMMRRVKEMQRGPSNSSRTTAHPRCPPQIKPLGTGACRPCGWAVAYRLGRVKVSHRAKARKQQHRTSRRARLWFKRNCPRRWSLLCPCPHCRPHHTTHATHSTTGSGSVYTRLRGGGPGRRDGGLSKTTKSPSSLSLSCLHSPRLASMYTRRPIQPNAHPPTQHPHTHTHTHTYTHTRSATRTRTTRKERRIPAFLLGRAPRHPLPLPSPLPSTSSSWRHARNMKPLF